MSIREEGLLTNDGWQVRLYRDQMFDRGYDVHVFRYAFRGEKIVREYVSFGPKGEATVHVMDNGWFPETVRPSLRLFPALLRAFASALIEEGLIPTTPREERLMGEAEATKQHLADMRRIALRQIPPTTEAA